MYFLCVSSLRTSDMEVKESIIFRQLQTDSNTKHCKWSIDLLLLFMCTAGGMESAGLQLWKERLNLILVPRGCDPADQHQKSTPQMDKADFLACVKVSFLMVSQSDLTTSQWVTGFQIGTSQRCQFLVPTKKIMAWSKNGSCLDQITADVTNCELYGLKFEILSMHPSIHNMHIGSKVFFTISFNNLDTYFEKVKCQTSDFQKGYEQHSAQRSFLFLFEHESLPWSLQSAKEHFLLPSEDTNHLPGET